MPHNTTKTRPSSSRPLRCPCVFSRPPLQHVLEPDELEHYLQAFETFELVFRSFTQPMLEAAHDAATAVRAERGVIG